MAVSKIWSLRGGRKMDNKILIITDGKRNIPYKEVITFYDIDIFNMDKLNFIKEISHSLVIVDTDSSSKCITIGNIIRLSNMWIPILIVVNAKTSLTEEFQYLNDIKGLGQIKILRWKGKYPYEIVDNIQSILKPMYFIKPSDIAVVIPIYNEAARINYVYDFISKIKIMIEKGFTNASIFFLNDGSTDQTEELVNKLLEHYRENVEWIDDKASISYYKLDYNTKKAGTYIEALSYIRADTIIFVDSDDSFKIDDIALMLNIIKLGYYDIVIGTKDKTADDRNLARRIVSFFKRFVTKPLLPCKIDDSQTGLKIMNWNCAKYILPYLHEDMQLAIDLEMLYIAKKLKFRVFQLPVKCTDREGSHVNIIKDSLKFIKSIFKIKRLHRNMN
ncbi:glycosyltransferase [Clostridium acetobutylicum]|uniref:Glycosyltransferase n=2 Tax=Clostridiaceae TaxID=31979 RepID=Q97GF9_CLOAB|nr:Glycosyltransferase [Clostridium acetobutylicum ATCC 824]AEI32323.1 glycosyltransferase [Clostridium acetobutylicum DSM 1731]AWV79217.1 glycosyltransferase [Clostridium acetobutylicum]PSM07177.1 glycosyl transferase [Clostridium sp. NJ4]MBC2394817.1 glycosyltransferase [Clostridium acetobutylicum]